MTVYYQATQPIIKFSHDVYTNETDKQVDNFLGVYFTFSTSKNTGLQSYNFSRSVKEIVGSFSITIKELPDSKVNFLDSVRPLDIVKIYETDINTPDFIGVVNNISFGAVSGALSKIITVSGKSIECLFDLYKLSLDVSAMSNVQAKPLNVRYTELLYSRKTIKEKKSVQELVTLSKPKTKTEALENLKKAFDYKNLDLIKEAYNSSLVTAKDAVNKLLSNGYNKDYVVGILVNAFSITSYLLEASGYKKKSDLEKLRQKYKAEAKKLNEKNYVTREIEVDRLERNPILITDCIKKLLGIVQGVMIAHSDIGTLAIYDLLKKYYQIKDSQSNEEINIEEINIDCDLFYNYPITSNPFTESAVKILDYVRNLLPNNVYEFFGTIKNGYPYLVIRENPFGTIENDKENYSNFLALDIGKIPANLITDYTFTLSNEQVYTTFLSYLEGSSLSSEQYLIITAKQNGYETAIVDETKSRVYGYSLLRANFLGFQSDGQESDNFNNNIIKKFSELNKKLKLWYGRLDEMFTGDVTVVNVKKQKYAKIGEVIQLCGAYFYVTSENHSWRFGDSPRINYKLDRGGIYSTNNFSRIKGLSKQYAELDL